MIRQSSAEEQLHAMKPQSRLRSQTVSTPQALPVLWCKRLYQPEVGILAPDEDLLVSLIRSGPGGLCKRESKLGAARLSNN